MPKRNKTTSGPISSTAPARTRHAQLTPEAFREITEHAIEELYDNSDTFELLDLKGWCRALVRRIGETSDHVANGSDVAADAMSGMHVCDAGGN